jgi:DnaK suppressor protein
MTVSPRERLQSSLSANTDQIRELERQYDDIVAASKDTSADDEHDPEGATIAFERQQLVALLEQSHQTRDDILHALTLLERGAYGVCETCGQPIGAERLEARPNARTCIRCAARRGS